jgi:hypothetical protein
VVTPSSTKPSSAVQKTPATPVVPVAQAQQPPASPHLFSPKFDDPHAKHHHADTAHAHAPKAHGTSGPTTAIIPTGKLGSKDAIEQKGPVHSYNPPCMQSVFKALQCKGANNQIYLVSF